MKPGQLYRIDLAVSLEDVQRIRAAHGDKGQKALLREIEERLGRSGFSAVLAVMQDPTDNRVFRAVARFAAPAPPDRLKILSLEEVEEPQARARGVEGVQLDPGLTGDELWALRQALARESNPRRLYGLGQTFAPFFPVAMGLAYAKATLVENQADAHGRELEKAHRERVAELDAKGSLRPPMKRTPANDIAKLLRNAGARWPDVEEALGKLRPLAFPWYDDRELRAREKRNTPVPLEDAIRDYNAYATTLTASGKPLPITLPRDEVKRVACDVIAGQLDEVRKAPRPVRDLGFALVRDLGYGVMIVEAQELRTALPPAGDEGFVSPSALQLMLATFKPVFAGVSDKSRIGTVMARLSSAKVPPEQLRQHILAKNQIERAERALERQRWVDWHRRAEWQW